MSKQLELPDWWNEEDIRAIRTMVADGSLYDLMQLVKECRKAKPDEREFCRYKVVRETIKIAEGIM